MTADRRPEPSPLPLTRKQIAAIARQESADAAVIHEALRRMGENPRLRMGEVRSPGAFFRGIVRAVIDDPSVTPPVRRPGPDRSAALPSPPTKPVGVPAEPDRTPGRMALRARRMFADGAGEGDVGNLLHQEFPLAPPGLVAWAITNGLALHHALTR